MAYKIKFDNFFSYAFSLDCVIFGYEKGKIHALLIKRAMKPFIGDWAIPGDLVYPDEGLSSAASRILIELTKVEGVKLHQGQTFGKPDRHPQGRVITSAYFALVRKDDVNAVADSWAEEVNWLPIRDIPQLAFDHNEIIESTFELLCQKLKREPICFDLLPEKFTLNEMQQLYEYSIDSELDKANFRKKIKSIPLINLNEKQFNVKHRPAKLFKFDSNRYSELVEKENYLFRM